MSKGKIIVIEGVDGSGKETQMSKLKERLDKENIKYLSLSFPNYDSPSSSLVKMYLNGEFGKKANDIDPYIASTFYTLDRYATYKKEIEEYYKEGGLILLDRYTTANMVHQASKIDDLKERDEYLDWLCEFEFVTFKLPIPDIVFFLDMPVFYGQRLIKNRNNKINNDSEKDLHEKDIEYLEKCYDSAIYVSNKYNWNKINCIKNEEIRTIEDIHEEIYTTVKGII